MVKITEAVERTEEVKKEMSKISGVGNHGILGWTPEVDLDKLLGKDLQTRRQVKFASAGQVDNGKTSLTSAVMFAAKNLDPFLSCKANKGMGKSEKQIVSMMDNHAEEIERGVTINSNTKNFSVIVKLDNGEHELVNIILVDNPGHNNYLANAIKGMSLYHCGILLVCATSGFTDGTRCHFNSLAFAGGAGVHMTLEERKEKLKHKHITVICNKIDCIPEKDIEDMLDIIKSEVAESAEYLGFNEENITYIGVSATQMLKHLATGEGEGERHLINLLDVVQDTTSSIVNSPWFSAEKIEEEFRMPIDDILTVPGSGTIVVGTPISGTIRTGDMVYVTGGNPKHHKNPYKIGGMQAFHENQDSACKGQNVGIRIIGIKKEHIDNKCILSHKPLTRSRSFSASVRLNNQKEIQESVKGFSSSKDKKSFSRDFKRLLGYEPMICTQQNKCPSKIVGMNVEGKVIMFNIDDKNNAMYHIPMGKTVTLLFNIEDHEGYGFYLESNDPFMLRESGLMVGSGTVKEIFSEPFKLETKENPAAA